MMATEHERVMNTADDTLATPCFDGEADVHNQVESADLDALYNSGTAIAHPNRRISTRPILRVMTLPGNG